MSETIDNNEICKTLDPLTVAKVAIVCATSKQGGALDCSAEYLIRRDSRSRSRMVAEEANVFLDFCQNVKQMVGFIIEEKPPSMSLFSIHDVPRGLGAYVAGLRWLRERPRYLILLFVPIAVGLLFMTAGLAFVGEYHERIAAAVLFQKPDVWYLLLGYYLCLFMVNVAIAILAFITSLLLMNIVAAPIYDVVSAAVEKDLTGAAPPSLSLSQHLAVILGEAKKVFLILVLSTILLFIPGVNVVSTLVTAFLVGWDFFDYPLARRGWTFRQRLDLVSGEGWAVLGLGLWLVIPFVQIVMLPLAVVGGTMLSLDSMARQGLIAPIVPKPFKVN